MTGRLLLAISVFLPGICCAQTTKELPDTERLMEELFPAQQLDLNYGELYENHLQSLSNPYDLNTIKPEEMKALFVLNDPQVESFLNYRAANGSFLAVYELQCIPLLDLTTIHKLEPFVKVSDPSGQLDQSLLHRIISEDNNYLIMRSDRTLQKRKAYRSATDSSQRYEGSPWKQYMHFRVSKPGDFSIGLTAEKDPGEINRWSPRSRQYGFDYYSMHAQVSNKGWIRNMIMGDFQAQFGQGLILGGGFGMGKGAETISTLRRPNVGFLPYASSNESGFFRGAALTTGLSRHISLHVFGSALARDGDINNDSSEENTLISSFAVTGYHRTNTEMASRKKISESNFGGVVDWASTRLNAGLLFHQTNYYVSIHHKPTLYNQFVFNGDQNINTSFYLNYNDGNFSIFSEAASTLAHGSAFIGGVLGSLTPSLDISFLYRNFGRDFHSLYGNAISEATNPQNESGMYWGLKYAYHKKIILACYLDLFQFPWFRYRAYAPGDGSEWMFRLTYQPSKLISMYVQCREESKPRNQSEENALYVVATGIKRNCWLNCDYAASNKLKFKTRLQFSTFNFAGVTTRGWVLLQDITANLGKVSISGRYALFDTDDYDNRQYAYERDVALAFSFPAYYGIGVRQFLIIHYKFNRRLDLWLRTSQTRYSGVDVIGSAGETIRGNLQNDIKLQARIRFH